jgi:phosphoribosylaminoimidazolecarboxamide formyltransferase / IMP cyclohydrolase
VTVDRVPVRRALVSVYDKAGLEELARGLVDLGVELWSSGGTAAALEGAGIPVVRVEDVTGAPEMLGGRVKTLHPRVHGGILADRGQPSHLADIETHDIGLVDMVVSNLYPFLDQPSIETIDIGGPAMVRAAAKNHAWVAVVTDPSRYADVLAELRSHDGTLAMATRRALALEAFAHTASYDAAIVTWLQADEDLPKHLIVPMERAAVLRYGENPHQQAARYERVHGAPGFHSQTVQHGGKELSYINLLDVEAGYGLVAELDGTACVVIKHANPAGVSFGADVHDAYRRAFDCDPLSAFGGVIAFNRPVSVAAAQAIAQAFTEVVVAPGYEPGAVDVLTAKKNVRVLEAPLPVRSGLAIATIDGGFLVQDRDLLSPDTSTWHVVTKAQPDDALWSDLRFAYAVCARTVSNTIVLAKDGTAYGIGAGQQSRVHSAEMAAKKAAGRAAGGVCASDAFFPFRDGLDTAAAAGVAAVVQPGGSVNDPEVIGAADEHGIAMVFTGRRHFRH